MSSQWLLQIPWDDLVQEMQKRGRRIASMKRKPDEKNTVCGQLTPSAPGVKVQCCAQPFSQKFMLPFPVCSPAGWLLEHIRNRQHWNAYCLCSFPYSNTDQCILSPSAPKGMNWTLTFTRLWRSWVKLSMETWRLSQDSLLIVGGSQLDLHLW